MVFNIDTRTKTDYGVVRTYWGSTVQFDSISLPDTAALATDYAFIQFAGFTFGKAISQYDTPWTGYLGNSSAFFVGGSDSITGVPIIAYGKEFGDGLSIVFSAEDPNTNAGTVNNGTIRRAGLIDVNAITAAQSVNGAWGNSYGGDALPELVGRFRVDQPWGLFQIAAAAHRLNAKYYSAGGLATEAQGHPGDKWGFATQAGLLIKNLPTGPGDTLTIDASYSEGAVKYLVSGTVPIGFSMFGRTNVPGAYQGLAFADLADAVYTGGSSGSAATGSGLELTTGWALRSAFTHNWTPQLVSSVFASYTGINYNGNATALICSRYAAIIPGQGSTYNCNPDFRIWQVGTRLGWTPVKNLTFSSEVMYTQLETGFSGAATLTSGGTLPSGLFKPTGVYEFRNLGTTSVLLRVQRNI